MTKDRYEIKDFRLAVDTESNVEVTLVNKLKRRAKYLEAEADFEEALAMEGVATATVKPPPKPPRLRKIRKRKKSSTSSTLVGLRYINEMGEVNYDDLMSQMFPGDHDKAETKRLRNNLYGRVKNWKDKEWLIQNSDGSWGVPEGMLEEAGRVSGDD